ncbi:MAG: T9SS type A sorting domain-containing protein [Moheibacter sp.]
MKKIYFLLVFGIGMGSLFAQNPDLYRSWDLREIFFELGYPIYIDEVEPEISPYIHFFEDNSFIGHSACSQFSGIAETMVQDGYNFIQFSNVNFPNVDCGNEVMNQIESVFQYILYSPHYQFHGTHTNPETGNREFGIPMGFDHLLFESTLDSKLFDTWYLQEIQIEISPGVIVSEFAPAIAPSLTLNEDLSYEGMSACNTFSGNFSLNEEDLYFNTYHSTDMNCETQELNDFETLYAYLFSGEEHHPMWIYHNNQTGELELWFGSSTSIAYRFTKTAVLGTQDFTQTPAKIYPNPATDYLFVENIKVNSVFQIFDTEGKFIQKGKIDSNSSINVSHLEKGIYVVIINGQSIKFLKK